MTSAFEGCYNILSHRAYCTSYFGLSNFRNSPSRRHLFLGQMLLLGLLLGSSMGFAYAVEPNEFSCAAVRLGTGLSYALIYSSLLCKLVFLVRPITYLRQRLFHTICVSRMRVRQTGAVRKNRTFSNFCSNACFCRTRMHQTHVV